MLWNNHALGFFKQILCVMHVVNILVKSMNKNCNTPLRSFTINVLDNSRRCYYTLDETHFISINSAMLLLIIIIIIITKENIIIMIQFWNKYQQYTIISWEQFKHLKKWLPKLYSSWISLCITFSYSALTFNMSFPLFTRGKTSC
jgi:hypothetical protein